MKQRITAISIDNNTIAKNDYDLSVSSYVKANDTREKTGITALSNELAKTVEKTNVLRADIDQIIKEIEV